jgi:hypothetical protein
MRRLLFTVAASVLLVALAPASAMARGHHRHHSRHHARHHARVRHERFGAVSASSSPADTETAGTVMSFSGGILTIRLNDGSTVSGAVNAGTELECEAAAPMQAFEDSGGGPSADDGTTTADDVAGADVGEEEAETAESCTTADLAPTTVVREAELTISSGGAVWNKVELVL